MLFKHICQNLLLDAESTSVNPIHDERKAAVSVQISVLNEMSDPRTQRVANVESSR